MSFLCSICDDESKASVAYIYPAHLINKYVGTNHVISLVVIKLREQLGDVGNTASTVGLWEAAVLEPAPIHTSPPTVADSGSCNETSRYPK
jgi:hypothetical protein